MNRPDKSHMEAYLNHLKTEEQPEIEDQDRIEAEYLRSIFKVLPREQGLHMSVKQARAKTVIKP